MSSDPITLRHGLRRVTQPRMDRAPRTVRAAFDAISRGRAGRPRRSPVSSSRLRMRGESAALIAAAAQAMRGAMVAVDHGLDATLDTCGTGGDGHGTLNVSTAAAIVAASLGITVAKHGNRAMLQPRR